MRNKRRNILLVTGSDDAYRRDLLESQGYCVTSVQGDQALPALERQKFHFVLVTSGTGIANAAEFCGKVKTNYPKMCIGVVAQHGERAPLEAFADVIIRAQYSPAAFLGAINTVLPREDDTD